MSDSGQFGGCFAAQRNVLVNLVPFVRSLGIPLEILKDRATLTKEFEGISLIFPDRRSSGSSKMSEVRAGCLDSSLSTASKS